MCCVVIGTLIVCVVTIGGGAGTGTGTGSGVGGIVVGMTWAKAVPVPARTMANAAITDNDLVNVFMVVNLRY